MRAHRPRLDPDSGSTCPTPLHRFGSPRRFRKRVTVASSALAAKSPSSSAQNRSIKRCSETDSAPKVMIAFSRARVLRGILRENSRGLPSRSTSNRPSVRISSGQAQPGTSASGGRRRNSRRPRQQSSSALSRSANANRQGKIRGCRRSASLPTSLAALREPVDKKFPRPLPIAANKGVVGPDQIDLVGGDLEMGTLGQLSCAARSSSSSSSARSSGLESNSIRAMAAGPD